MQNTTSDYKLEIAKDNIEVNAKIIIGNNVYTSQDVTNLVLEYTQSQEGFTIGNTLSQSLDLTLLNRGDIIYSTSQIKLEIGLKIGDKYEYIPMGVFNIDDVVKTDYTTKFTCYDNMIKFEKTFKTNLGDTLKLQQVVNELTRITGVEFTGSLPNYTVSKLEGFTCREVLSYVASICGGNAIITRDGKFTIKGLAEVEKSIDGHNIILNNFKTEELKYKVGQVSCQVNDTILTKGSLGTDSMGLQFENPWVTESILNDIYNKVKTVEFLGYSMKWTGDLALDLYDIVLVTDAKNVTRKFPILSQKLTCTKGIISEMGAKGETKNKNSFSSSGSNTNKLNRVSMELAVINTALIDKANIKDLEVANAKIYNLETKTAQIEETIIGVAHIEDLNAINANIEKLIAADATINNALIGKADITELNAVKGTINSLDSKIANVETLVNGNLSSENIQVGGITGANLNMDTIFVKDANMVNVNINSLKAGDFSTTKFRIVSDSGKMLISDNTIQIRDNNRVRVQIGKDASNDYNMYVWDSAGKLMFDATGLKADGIKNKIIRNDMISDSANIDGSKINISSLVTEINKDTNTSVIKSTKVQIDSLKQTLDVAFNSLKNQADKTESLTESHSTTIGVMQGQINTAINNTQIVKDGQTVLLKDDYNRTVAKVDSINSTIGTHTTKINELSGNITSVDTKVNSVQRDLEGTKSTISSHSTSISDLSSKVSTQGASMSQLQNQIKLKVEATDITTAINNISIGSRNYVLNSDTYITGNSNKGFSFSILKELRGKTVTLSVEVDLNEAIGSRVGFEPSIRFSDGTQQYLGVWQSITSITTMKKRIVATYTIYDKEIVSYNQTGMYIQGLTSGTARIGRPKLEIGNKATDWTPAQEDIDSSIANVQTQVTTTSNKVATIETNLSSITQRVSSTESTVNTHTSQLSTVDSRINTAKNSAISTAASDATSKANTAQTNAINSAKSYTDGQITTVNQTITNKVAEIKATTDSITSTVSKVEQIATSSLQGKMLFTDPTFKNGSNSISTYNNAGNGNVVVSRVAKSGDCPTTSSHMMQITTKGTASPGHGGFYFGNMSRANAIFITKIIAKIPSGCGINFATNAVGTGGISEWLTSNVGTGNWKEYILKVTCGSSGSFSSTNYFYLSGGSAPVTWHLAFATVFDITETNNIESRMESAEQKITPTAITATISSVITGGTGSISTTQFVMDKNGLTINNGALRIKNKSGTTVLNSDTNGNLIITGEMRSQYGQQWVGLNAGGLTFQDWNRNEQMLRVGLSYFESNRDMNGVNFALAKYGDFIRFSHIAKTDLTNGWSPSDTQYNFFDCWSSDQTVGGVSYKKGINVYSPMFVNNGIQLFSGTNYPAEILGAVSWDNGKGVLWNLLGLYGDNGVVLGYKSGSSLQARFIVSEAAHPGTGDNLISWGNYNFNGYTFHNASIAANYLTVSGSKNCLQKTKNYGSRLINAYETAEYYFGDLGFGKINEDGECLVYIEDIFLECINTNVEYHVFTQIYNGVIKTIERYKTYFIVKGEPGTNFSWQLMGKRIGYENNRLDTQEIETQGENKPELFGDGDFKAETSEDTLMNSITFELEDLLMEG